MKVLLQDASGKQVKFSPNTAEYMLSHGWKKVPAPKQKTKPVEAKK